jgi:hypothetical protein
MRKFNLLFVGLWLFILVPILLAQETREELVVPKADSGAITIDGIMDEAAWAGAAEINLVTSTGYNIFANKYYREGLAEPEFDELYARLLWSQDTLYVFVHIDEFVNDSTDLFWVQTQGGHWGGDQLFVSLSNRLGAAMKGWYDGNVYTAPDGPYHFLILGDMVSLNADEPTYVPDEYRGCPDDSLKAFIASDIANYAVTIDMATGVWDVEMAIYNPNVNANAEIGFNIGGSMGSTQANAQFGDAYGYYTWQPNIADDPFGDPYGNGDPGFYNLANTDHWAVLKFEPGPDDYVRPELNVPQADSGAVVIDGIMDEAAWSGAAEINLVTSTGYNIFANKYYREDLAEPEFDELYARLLWSEDTLYLFVHIDEFVNDSTDLFWVQTQSGHWGGDQLFVSLSNRLGVNMKGWYDGNVYAAPDGPYHFLILGDMVSLNADDTNYVPVEYRMCFDQSDSLKAFIAADIANYAVNIDMAEGIWDVEMAIYNPHITAQSSIGFNIGGSMGSTQANAQFGDAYGYYTWQPNIADDPFGDPYGNGDPGFYNLANADYWALINFQTEPLSVKEEKTPFGPPTTFNVHQNYPNPFNPTTTIKFEVPVQSSVYLKIFNIVGEEIATLVNGEVLNNGAYSVTFDASSIASGIYFYQLRADNFVQTRKMVLLK